MDGMKQEYQKFYDLLASGAPGVAGPTMELIMRTLDQDGMQASQDSSSSSINRVDSSPSISSNNETTTTTLGNPTNQQQQVQHSFEAPPPPPPPNQNQNQPGGEADQQQQQQQSSSMEQLHSNLVLHSLGMENNNAPNNNNNNNGGSEDENGSSGGGERPHICQICSASYKTRTHLRRHMFVHLNNRPYPCGDCGKGFNRKEHLTKHIEAVHSGTKHKCGYCGKEISRKDHLSRHIKNMHPSLAAKETDGSVLKLQLPSPNKSGARLSFLTPTYSSSSLSSPPKDQLGLGLVGRNSGSEKSLTESQMSSADCSSASESQMSEEQDSTGGMNILDAAFQAFTQVSIVPGGSIIVPGALPGQIAATVTVGSPIVTPSPSDSSGAAGDLQKSSSSRGTLQSSSSNGLVGLTNLSLSLGGQMREPPFGDCDAGGSKKKAGVVLGCSDCSASFSSEKELAAHLRSHKPQNFRCTECPRAYTRREKLTEHIRCFHQGQKFKCEYCGKELSRKDHVLRHVRSIHPEVLASRFTAHLQETNIDCGGGQEGLGGNIVLSSSGGGAGGALGSSSSSAMNEMGVLLRSVCHVCLKVFGTSYHLSRHIDSCHKGDVRPYSCNSCSKQFKRKDHLTKHMKSHCPSSRDSQHHHRRSPDSSAHRNKVPSQGKSANEGDKSSVKSKKPKPNAAVQSGKKDGTKTETSRLKDSESDFNLAMINSFIAENVAGVVDPDLSNLMNSGLHQGSSGTSGSNSSVGSERGSRENVLHLEEGEEGGGGGGGGGESVSLTTAISSQHSFRHPLIQHDVNSTSTINKLAY